MRRGERHTGEMENFKNMFNTIEERVEPQNAQLTGEWPAWLKGNLIRVGPGKFDFGDFTLNHWLDGMAIMHKFQIDGGQVTFRSKYLRSDAYKKACVAQRPVYTEFGTHCFPDPGKNIFSRMFSPFEITDNASSSVVCVQDQVFVSSETCYIRRIDPATLDTKEKVDLNKLMGIHFASSHPITDNTGTTYNLGCSFMSGPKYHMVRVPPAANNNLTGSDPFINARTLATVSSSWKACYGYYHSFSVSENYLVFLEQPLLVNTLKLATSQLKSRALNDCFEWHPQEKVKFIVIRKATGEVVKTRYISKETFFVFHHVNAYEVDDKLVVDVIAYERPSVIDKFYLNKIRQNQYSTEDPAKFKRFVLPMISDSDLQNAKEGEELAGLPGCSASAVKAKGPGGVCVCVEGEVIGEPGFDMPIINKQFIGQRYQYVYGTGGYDQGNFKNSVCKMDVDSGDMWVWRGTETQYATEPTFVPRPDAIDEDDGVLLMSVGDVEDGAPDFLLLLDAKTMQELGRANIEGPLPCGIHGVFIPDKY